MNWITAAMNSVQLTLIKQNVRQLHVLHVLYTKSYFLDQFVVCYLV